MSSHRIPPARVATTSSHFDALPGIATSLADRLRLLVEHGVVEVTTTAPPTVATVYQLTPWGLCLDHIVLRLGRWGAWQLLDGQGDRLRRPDPLCR